MAFVSASEIIGNTSPRRHSSAGIVLATDKQRASGQQYFAVRISLSRELADRARFILGDRVDVMFDIEGRRCLLRRVNEGGWRLHKAGGNGASDGARLNIKFKYSTGLPSVKESVSITDYEIAPEGIIFGIPEEASFERNLRDEEGETEGRTWGASGLR